jgi:hypothetical protein
MNNHQTSLRKAIHTTHANWTSIPYTEDKDVIPRGNTIIPCGLADWLQYRGIIGDHNHAQSSLELGNSGYPDLLFLMAFVSPRLVILKANYQFTPPQSTELGPCHGPLGIVITDAVAAGGASCFSW